MLAHLVEIMLIEALRWRLALETDAPIAGLLAGLADSRIALALRLIHQDVARQWTIEELARQIGMSRAAFSARFTSVLGVPTMEYVARWRMALAKNMLWHDGRSLGEVAHAIGYQSPSAFSAAFNRSVGITPGIFARAGSTHGSPLRHDV
jgi:AraC-like DNA-binding protein